MSALFVWSGLLLGPLAIAYAVAVLLAEPDPPGEGGGARPFRWLKGPAGLAVVAVVVFPFLLSLLQRPPFAVGGLLGWGWLIGGVAAALLGVGLAALDRLVGPGEGDERGTVAGALAIAAGGWTLMAANATTVIFPGWTAPLTGFAMAFCTVSLVLVAMAGEGSPRVWRLLASQALLAVALAGAGTLASYHYPGGTGRTWVALPLSLASVGLLVSIVATRLGGLGAGRSEGGRMAVVVLVGLCVMTPVALLMTTQLNESLRAFGCVACGLVGLALAFGLVSSARPDEATAALQNGALVGMVVLATVTTEFRLLAGYGVALGLCGSWGLAVPLLSGLAAREPGSRRATWAARLMPVMTAWAMVPIYRAFMERYEAKAFDATIHYAFVGVGAGVLAALFIAGLAARRSGCGPWRTCASACGLGLLSALVPLLLVALWGENAGVGLLAGLALGALVLAATQASREGVPLVALLVLALMALSAFQLTEVVLPLAVAGRLVKLWVVVALLVVAAAWVVFGSRVAVPAKGEVAEE